MLLNIIKIVAFCYGILHLIRKLLVWKVWGQVDRNNEISAKGKIVIITGANSGIGRAAALEFAQRDANVILACREKARAESAIEWIREETPKGQLIFMQLDLCSLESVRKFATDFKAKYDHLDILVNNAGVSFPGDVWKTTKDNFEIHMGVNHLGHFLLTNLLLEPLKKGVPSRVVTVSSFTHARSTMMVEDMLSEKDKPDGIQLYCRSKMANALFSKELSKRFQGTGIRTYALCPGIVKTDIGRNMKGAMKAIIKFLGPVLLRFIVKTPEEGAATIMHCALSKSLVNESGEMYQHCGKWEQKSRPVLKDEDAKKLWEESAKLIGL